jgi:hypothetical protein
MALSELIQAAVMAEPAAVMVYGCGSVRGWERVVAVEERGSSCQRYIVSKVEDV